MLIDANILLYAADAGSSLHERAATWLSSQLNGGRRVGIPWESLTAFMRISTNPRVSQHPAAPSAAWDLVSDWLNVPTVWTPTPTEQHATVLGTLIRKYALSGKAVPDAHLAAIAIEHGLEICSADTDFARFTEVRWLNPLAG